MATTSVDVSGLITLCIEVSINCYLTKVCHFVLAQESESSET